MAKKRRARSMQQRTFWQEWGLYLVIGGAILLGLILFQSLRTGSRELAPSSHYRLYFTQGGQGAPTEDGLEAEIIADIAEAEERIELATPGLDLEDVATALVKARERGVQVRVLQDPARQEDTAVAAVTAQLQEAGIPVVLHPSEGGLGGAFLVVDQFAVWAGSWDISRQGLLEDSHCVLRFDLAEVANNFCTEFDEMFEQQTFGPTSPQNTPHHYISVLDGGSISVLFSPEDDPLEEVLRTIAASTNEFLLLTESLDDHRLEERIQGDARRSDVIGWAVLDAQGESSEETLQALKRSHMQLRLYSGPGRLRENAIVVDSRVLLIFSQPLQWQAIDRNDGYVLMIADPPLAKVFQFEFQRLYSLGQELPEPEGEE